MRFSRHPCYESWKALSGSVGVEAVQVVPLEFPLAVSTPVGWATAVAQDVPYLLNDHAHLEKKAAQNALDLLLVWPRRDPPEGWMRVLSAIAKDETHHLAQVLRLMQKRGLIMTRAHRSGYARDLRALVRRGKGPQETLDRLLASALIEARSAERFGLLQTAPLEPELRKLYRALWASEQGHYRVFLETARGTFDHQIVESRWEDLREAEAKIIRAQEKGRGLHSWI